MAVERCWSGGHDERGRHHRNHRYVPRGAGGVGDTGDVVGMSVAEQDEDEPWSEEIECEIHEIRYRAWTGCPYCSDDAADRGYVSNLEKRR